MTSNNNQNESSKPDQEVVFQHTKSDGYKSSHVSRQKGATTLMNQAPGIAYASSFPASKAPDAQAFEQENVPSKVPQQTNLKQENIVLEVTDSKTADPEAGILFVKSKVALAGCLIDTPYVYSKLNSLCVSGSPSATLNYIRDLVSNVLRGDITQFDDKNFIIHALLFQACEPVNIRVSIWNNIEIQEACTVEIKRMQGSCLAFSSLFNQMRGKLEKQLNIVSSESESEMSSGLDLLDLELDYDFSSVPEMMSLDSNTSESGNEFGFTDEDLQSFADDIRNDSFQLETLGIVEKCVPKNQVLKHQNLSDAINTCAKSNDLAVQKICARILS